jgi:hypothetical protein
MIGIISVRFPHSCIDRLPVFCYFLVNAVAMEFAMNRPAQSGADDSYPQSSRGQEFFYAP